MSFPVEDKSRLTNWPAVVGFVPTNHSDTYPYISTASADLSGKSVLVAGASRGIGRQTALSFARAGASRIAVAARSNLAELEKAIVAAAVDAGRPKPKIVSVQADLTTEAGAAALKSRIDADFGGVLDVLINNAGRCENPHTVHESNVDDVWATWDINSKWPLTMSSPLEETCIRTRIQTSVERLLTPA